jgi:pimeloyl-ACP methyl ester carboxylesterase
MSPLVSHPSAAYGGLACLERPGDAARTVVVLHGIGGRASTFAPLFAHWPAGPRLLACDAPGYGGSAALASDWPDAAEYAGRVLAFVDSLGVPRVDLVGHSLGCVIAGAYASCYPDRVRRLVLMAAAPGYGIARGADLPANLASRLAEFERLGPTAFAAQRAGNLIADATAKPEVFEFVRDAMAAVSSRGYGQAVRMLAHANLLGSVPRIGAPTLIINGTEDRVTPIVGARTLYDAFAARAQGPTEFVGVDGAGHAVSIEQPAHVAAVISAFLERP